MSPREESAPPRLSVTIPLCNGEPFLEETLEDLSRQEFRDFEVVLSDDASEDATREICRRWAAQDPRIRYLRSDEPRGLPWHVNRLIAEARGEYLKLTSQAERMHTALLGSCMGAIQEAPRDVVLVYARHMLLAPDGTESGPYEDRMNLRQDDPVARLNWLVRKLRMNNALHGVVRTSVMRDTRGMLAPPGMDNVLLAELALRGRFWEIAEALSRRRVGWGATSWRPSSAAVTARPRPATIRRLAAAHLDAIALSPLTRRQKRAAVRAYLTALAVSRSRHHFERLLRAPLRRVRRNLSSALGKSPSAGRGG